MHVALAKMKIALAKKTLATVKAEKTADARIQERFALRRAVAALRALHAA